LVREQQLQADFNRGQAGNIDYDSFERLLRPETRLIITTHASNLTGNLLDITRIGAFAKANKAPLHS
jgi:selenocysteine lyase/cysteine desulfurase